MDKNHWITLSGTGVALLGAALMTITDIVPAWVGITGALVGVFVFVFGMLGLLFSKDKLGQFDENGTKIEIENGDKENVQSEKHQTQLIVLKLPPSEIDGIIDMLDAFLEEAKKGIPDSEANISKLRSIEAGILKMAAKTKSPVSEYLVEFCNEADHICLSYEAQKGNRENGSTYYTFRAGFLSKLRKVKSKLVNSMEADYAQFNSQLKLPNSQA